MRVLREGIEDCRETGVLFSLHVKATMMKVSHPIVFGHCVKIFYKDAFEKHGKLFEELGINVNNGMVDLYDKIATLPESKARRDHPATCTPATEHRPALAMVDSAKGITNFHSPNDIIVDASMPAMIRRAARCGADGKPDDSKCVMPESTFARIYQEMINFCKWHGNFDPRRWARCRTSA